MRIPCLMPVPRRENDVGGRFTTLPISIHNVLAVHLFCFFGVRLDARTVRDRSGNPEVDGSDPPLRESRAGVA